MAEDSTTAEQQDTDEQEQSEDLKWVHPGGDSDDIPTVLNGRDMRRRLPRLVHHTFALAWQVDPRSALVLIVCQVVSGLLSALGLFATTRALSSVIQAATDPSRLDSALPSVLVLTAAAGLRALLGIVIQALSQRLSPRIQREVGTRLLLAGVRTEMSSYDADGFSDRYNAAERGVDQAQQALGQTQNLVSSLATLVAASVVLAALYPPLLPLLLLAALPQAATALKGERITYVATVATFRDRRVLYLLRWTMVAKDAADQIRTDTITPHLMGKYQSAGDRVDRTTDQAAWQRAKITLYGAAASGIASGVLWAAVWVLLDTGRISAAAAGTAIFALRSASTSLQGIIGYGSQLLRSGFYMDDADRFVKEAEQQQIRVVRGTTAITGPPERIELRGVSFSYPGSEEPTLRDVDFEVRRGEIVAVVGVNGSGKTTLMKLLCGLNLPTQGEVLWDGVSVRDLDADTLWRECSVVPQEFARWPMNVRENVTLGQPQPDGDAAVMRAAAASSADDVITTLRSGLDTLLAREMWGGVALSSGQWQRLAVARALHRGAGLLVMDEPTSDLDPHAEHRIFNGLREIARNRAVVLVTHNVGNTAAADRIVVLSSGRIVQEGTFTQLTAAQGPLRDMWLLSQNRSFPTQNHEQEPVKHAP
ncbi:ATP-binding cassette domain-containing protein [Streptacidiphilus cavernicola]|uniref:ATP-binding cassette domain-containing protein n=1 Tax=Streptacidiphilus cavernicola TaxID=3342716 RepID=A0ABV6VYB9_9ACTN